MLTEANREEVSPRFFHRSRQEAKQVVAEIGPVEKAPRRTVVTSRTSAPTGNVQTTEAVLKTVSVQPVELDLTHPAGVRPPIGPMVERTTIQPLSRASVRMHVSVSPERVALLEKAKTGESHVRPNATDDEILRAALELLIRQQERRKASVPREAQPPARGGSRRAAGQGRSVHGRQLSSPL